MTECCQLGADIPERQRRVLRIVLAINLALFGVELGAGLLAHSTALLADSMDMLGDAFVYAFSLYVVARGVLWQARAAIVKGAMMAAFGAGYTAGWAWITSHSWAWVCTIATSRRDLQAVSKHFIAVTRRVVRCPGTAPSSVPSP